MGRREDGAAGGRPRCGLDPTGSMTGEIPPSADAAPRVRSNALRLPGDGGAPLPGIGPGARSWLTGVAGPRSQSAARQSQNAASGAPEGAFLRFATEERGDRKTSHRAVRIPPTGGLASPSACRRSAPLDGRRELQLATRACPGPTNKTHGYEFYVHRHSGGRAGKAPPRASSRNTREPGIRSAASKRK